MMVRVSYNALLLPTGPGQLCGEVPDVPDVVAYGASEAEVVATLRGLLEEWVDAEHELPPPAFDAHSLDRQQLPDARVVSLPICLPDARVAASTSNRLHELHFNAVVLRTQVAGNGLAGHFPDLPAAFTTGSDEQEVRAKLQGMLDHYVGLLIKDGLAVPEPRFTTVEELDMSEQELRSIVCIARFSVVVPF